MWKANQKRNHGLELPNDPSHQKTGAFTTQRQQAQRPGKCAVRPGWGMTASPVRANGAASGGSAGERLPLPKDLVHQHRHRGAHVERVLDAERRDQTLILVSPTTQCAPRQKRWRGCAKGPPGGPPKHMSGWDPEGARAKLQHIDVHPCAPWAEHI